MAHHWKGVWGLGTWVDTLTVTFGSTFVPSLLLQAHPDRAGFRGRRPRGISRTSSSSSVGRPIMAEVELHGLPAAREDTLGRLEELLLGHVLVDDVAHPLGAGFRSERDAGRPDARHVVEDVLVEAIRTQARDAEGHALREGVDDLLHEGRDARVVGGRQGDVRRSPFVVAALLHGAHDFEATICAGSRSRTGAIDHACLAEAAALGAAARDLDRHAVEDRLRAALIGPSSGKGNRFRSSTSVRTTGHRRGPLHRRGRLRTAAGRRR